MAFNINEFRSQMQGDGARPNLFEVTMPFPSFSSPGNAQTKLSFMCKTAQLFADWTITVINDEDFIIRNAFERWMNGINSHSLNVRTPLAQTPSSYSVDGEVRQFAKNGDVLKKYKFIGLFPSDITPIDVDWGANDTIEEFSVTLTYQWWESAEDAVV
jgi:hypothetical protein